MLKYIYTSLAVIFTLGLQAQETVPITTTSDTTVIDTLNQVKKIEVDEVEVIKAFEVKLGEAKRIGIGPKLEKVTPVKKEYKYDITIVPADIEYPDPVIKPLAMSPDAEPHVDHFYTKLGYGTYMSPYADASFYKLVPELYSFTIDARHYGFDNSQEIINQKVQETKLNLAFDYLLGENNIIGLDLNGALNNRNLKAPPSVPPTEIDYNRQSINLGGLLSFKNAETNSLGLDYNVSLGIQHLEISDNRLLVDQGNEEQDISANGSISKSINELFKINLNADAYYNTIHVDDGSAGNFTTELAPGISYGRGMFSFRAAADLILDENGLSPWVDAELGVEVTEGIQVYAGADQELLRNNLISSLDRNPYVTLDTTYQENTISKKIYGGVRGKVLTQISFDISGAYEDITNHYNHTDFGSLRPTFDVNYQDVKNIAIDANIEFKLPENSSVGGSLSQNFFDTGENEELTNLPTYHYEAYAKIGLLKNKLHLKGGLALSDNILYRDGLGQIVSGKSLTDLNMEIDYYITKNIAVWARGNNLLNQSYERYKGYNVLGLNANGGVILKF